MNSRHSKVTDWGLSHITIRPHDVVLDVGCGGGATVRKLAGMVTQGKVCGLDFSSDCVTVASRLNQHSIEAGLVEIKVGSVSELPFPQDVFDLVTAVETHFWWPDLPNDMVEVLRVLKPGGTLVIIAEIYKGAQTRTARLVEKYASKSGMKLLSVDQHRELFEGAGFTKIDIAVEPGKGWLCGKGTKPHAP